MATETLRPNAAGDETAISSTTGATHYGVCNDQSDASYVYDTGTTGVFKRDLYNMDNSGVGDGTINSVTVYARMYKDTNGFNDQSISLKTNGTTYNYTVTMNNNTETFDDYNTGALTTNPQSGSAWTWSEVDAIQAGPRIRSWNTGTHSACAEIWVVVDYTAATGDTSAPLVMFNF